MYFHSSNSRRDHYATLRNQHQVFKQQQQLQQKPWSSTSASIVSGTDSGYHSPSSSPLPHHIEKDLHHFGTNQDHHDNESTTGSFVTDSTTSIKKKKRTAKKHFVDHHPSRQPDLVYSSPRPLAFPFHNDCHFLPVAEADPRDIARIAPSPPPPSLRRNSSSRKTASLISSSHHRASISSIPEGDDSFSHNTNNDGRPASLINSVQQGTVRSLRSFFQMGGQQSQPQQQQQQQQQYHHMVTHDSSLSTLEPKPGTVASLRQLFSRPPAPTPHHADLEAETVIHTAKNSQSGNRTKPLFFGKQPRTQQQLLPSPPSNRFHLSRLWSSKKSSELLDELPKAPSAPPSTGLKRLFTRPVPIATDMPSTTPPRPLFASFRRSSRKDTKPQAPKKQPAIINDTLVSPPPSTTTVGRIWKNFKRLVNGNKVSRIGVL